MNIHFCGDVYVSATKSEGIGLGAITASSYNKPVIITKYGAQYEYLKNDKNARFISYTLYPAKDDLSFNLDLTNQLWAHPNISDMVDKMKTVYKL
jgi:glycosyltransferase involved in cell wall biosynthesis